MKTVATHWGLYEAGPAGLAPWPGDPAPSPLHRGLLEARDHPARILQPCVRRSFLEHGPGPAQGRRGTETFVAVSWDKAEALVANEITRVRAAHGNAAIFGGSYGWSSAGRFHHAQSQVHRFLNAAGGYVRSVQNYSFAAADVILPHVIGSTTGLAGGHTPWKLIADHADLLVLFGGLPARDAQVSAGGIARHNAAAALQACRTAGAALVTIGPLRDDIAADLDAEWLALRPNTDVALMLALAHVLITDGLCDQAFLGRYTTGFDRLRAYILGNDGTPKTPAWAAAITGLPASAITALAQRMAAGRTMIMMGWALQRARHGEQPVWMAVALAAMLGGIGLPGQGVGFGYASSGGIGLVPTEIAWPALPQGHNPVDTFIPVARIADMLLHPDTRYDYNGRTLTYPNIRLVYWAGGNPFHHHQDLNKLVRAWQRPETVVVHEAFWNAHARHADIVLPAATMLDRLRRARPLHRRIPPDTEPAGHGANRLRDLLGPGRKARHRRRLHRGAGRNPLAATPLQPGPRTRGSTRPRLASIRTVLGAGRRRNCRRQGNTHAGRLPRRPGRQPPGHPVRTDRAGIRYDRRLQLPGLPRPSRMARPRRMARRRNASSPAPPPVEPAGPPPAQPIRPRRPRPVRQGRWP